MRINKLAKSPLAVALTVGMGVTLAGCSSSSVIKDTSAEQGQTIDMPATASNPFFEASTLEYEYPQFDKIKVEHFGPAFDRGMADQKAEWDKIANNADAPTFENTILELEKSGQLLKRARYVFSNLTSADSNDAINALDSEYAPKFEAHNDSKFLNDTLFKRIDDLYTRRNSLGLDPQSVRLIERYDLDFVRAGAKLTPAQKERIKTINGQVAALQTKLPQNVLAEANASAVIVDSVDSLKGLDEAAIKVLAENAKANGAEGKYRIALLNTTQQPILTNLEDRALRERIFKASLARGSRGNQFDNTGPFSELVKLRAEKAKLLGYPNYASYSMAKETAKTPAAVNAMLEKIAGPAVAKAREEGKLLQALIDKEQKAKGQPTFKLEPWDWMFYSEKLRKEQYAFDEGQLKPYLEWSNVLENGVFFAAHELYGITLKRRTDLPVYHPDVRTYDAFNADGSKFAIVIVDPFARPSKQGGAWMSTYVDQNDLLNQHTVAALHLNVTKPAAGEPGLMTWDDVTTAFHEFGHVLHGIFSDVKYPYFSGTDVPRDFVEYPSQVNEMWAEDPTVIANYAKHWKTGEVMPRELLDKVAKASKFNAGFGMTEVMGATLLDQRWHQVSADKLPAAAGVMAFEAKALKDVGLDYTPVPPRYRTPYFKHIMEGYAAGYYAYTWSEVFDADTVEWMHKNGGLKRANGDRFRNMLLSKGGSEDALVLFKNFYGGEPDIRPLLERHGLVKAKK